MPRERIDDSKTRVSLTGPPPELLDAICLGEYIRQAGGPEGRVWYRGVWVKQDADGEGTDLFAIWDFTTPPEMPGGQVGRLSGWFTYDEVNEHYPEFGLVREED